ncbi:MAG: biopolymer transporter ExbD [Spartobacteria bacterium]|nr:biopolymer transporter ExbD [Spartobacteria bacterium]
MRRKGRTSGGEDGVNMTPMIDVVFQMIIFFVCTADLDRKAFDEKIKLALSPHGPAVEKKDPRTVTVEVDKRGVIKLGQVAVPYTTFVSMLRKTVAEYGQTTPVVIRADGATKHEDVKRVMDACSQAGLWKVKFSATKEKAKTVQ